MASDMHSVVASCFQLNDHRACEAGESFAYQHPCCAPRSVFVVRTVAFADKLAYRHLTITKQLNSSKGRTD